MILFNRTASVDIGLAGQAGTHITGLRISFKVKKSTYRTINSAEIKIYNLARGTREKLADTKNTIVLNAGYAEGGGEEVVFIGDIDSYINRIEPPNNILILEAGDGERVLRQTRIAVSFSGGVSAQEVLDGIVEKLPGLAVQEFASGYDVEFENGWSFVGPAADALDKITRSLEASWSIQNNEVQVIERFGNNNTEAVVVSPTTGLTGSPEKTDDLESFLEDEKRPQGWRIETLLMPKIIPGGIVSLASEEITGFLNVESVEHVGDLYTDKWNTTAILFEGGQE